MQRPIETYRFIRLLLCIAGGSFVVGVSLCILLRPDVVFDYPQLALSYFGHATATIIPYTVGLAINVACLAAISYRLRALQLSVQGSRTLAGYFLLSAIVELGVVSTSYPQDGLWFWTHMGLGLALAVLQLALITWIIAGKRATVLDYGLSGILLAGIAETALASSWVNVIHISSGLGETMVYGASILLLARQARNLLLQPSQVYADGASPLG